MDFYLENKHLPKWNTSDALIMILLMGMLPTKTNTLMIVQFECIMETVTLVAQSRIHVKCELVFRLQRVPVLTGPSPVVIPPLV